MDWERQCQIIEFTPRWRWWILWHVVIWGKTLHWSAYIQPADTKMDTRVWIDDFVGKSIKGVDYQEKDR